MLITVLDRLLCVLRIYWVILSFKMPLKQKCLLFINPLDATRYIEIPFLLKSLKTHGFNLLNKSVLDISSPYIIAYILSTRASVVKTDINIREGQWITSTPQLTFQVEDGVSLSYEDNYFDLTYSISVIEHVYNGYLNILSEMFRVTKSGGMVCVTFPISRKYREEWLEKDDYGHQYKHDAVVFFQYIFDEKKVLEIMNFLSSKGVIIEKGFYFEKKNGGYEELVDFLRKRKPLPFIGNSLFNFYYGFTQLSARPTSFNAAVGVGQACFLVRKR